MALSWVSSMSKSRQNIEKRGSVSFKGVKNEAFSIKRFFILCKIRQFSRIFKKKMFCNFYGCLASVLSIVQSDLFGFHKVIRTNLRVRSIKIFSSIGSVNDKNRLSECHPKVLLIFPFVNH